MFIYCLGFLFVANPDDPGRPKVVLIRKKRGPPNVRGKKNGIGGKIELPDETPLDAMIREAREEIGVATDRETWLPFGVMSGPDWRCHLFTGWLPDGQEPRTMEDEEVGVELAAACFGDSYVANIPTLLSLAEHALDSLTFAEQPVWVDLAYHRNSPALTMAVRMASGRSLSMWSATRPSVSFEAGDLRVSTFTIEPGRWVEPVPEAPISLASDLIGGYSEFGDGRQVPIVPNTATAWTYEPPHFAVGARADDSIVSDTDPDAQAKVATSSAPITATATHSQPPTFTLDLSRYVRAELRDCPPDADGNPMAEATCWVDYAALANDMAAARLPGELVTAVRNLESRQGGEGAHVASTAPVKPIVAHPGWAPMLGFIDDGLGAYCPRHPLLAWAAMGQTATVAQRTVHADWGIAFDGTREPVASFSGDEVELFWAPVGLSDDELAYFVPINVDRIRWPFVESEARPEHFAALGFRVLV